MSFYSANRALAVLLVSASLFADTSAYLPADLSEQVRTVLPSVVKIKIQRSDDSNEESELIAFEGGGSGFVFDRDHHVITNAHVIKGAKRIVLIDINRKEYPATVVGTDEKTDVAILSAPTFSAPPLSFGASNRLSIGEAVFVVGSPFSLGHSVSAGIVSMIGRYLPNYPYLPLIQTDAAINPGNSGGAVFNRNAEVVAMASTYYTKQGNYTNIGFAIPSEDFQRIGGKLLKEKKVSRGYLGAELWSSEKIARKIGYSNALLVTRIDAGSPAESAGIMVGDWIIGIDGHLFRYEGEFYRMLEPSLPGSDFSIMIVRDKKESSINLKLGNGPLETKNFVSNAGASDTTEKFGLIVRENSEGVSVLSVYPWIGAIGIEPGDRIVSIDESDIKTLDELNQRLTKYKENDVGRITIQREKRNIVLPFGGKTALKATSTRD